MTHESPFRRVLWVILDGVGAGELPDAAKYGDQGSDTLGNLSRALGKYRKDSLRLPNLEKLGLARLTPIQGLSPDRASEGSFGKARELSKGKDTSSGHWEMAGLVVDQAFPVFPHGFPDAVVR